MQIGSGGNTYDWVDGWAALPETESKRTGWAHHGVVVTRSGEVVTYHQGDPTIMVLDLEGNLLRSWDIPVADAHGITLVEEDGAEYLWIADNGAKRQAGLGYDYPPGPRKGQVLKTALDGRTVMSLDRPDLEVYREQEYSPTWVAVNEERHGGNGDVWVADGYGASHVHRYDRSGNYLSSINGEEGDAGAFDCPHAIFVDRRRGEPELYVADRSNSRIQVYDMDGRFERAFGTDFLTSPSGFATHGDQMIVAELRARLVILDAGDGLVCYLGDNEQVCDVAGWPNNRNEAGEVVPTTLLEPGKFNSPHGMAVDADGNIYVAEWLIGGRFTKLVKV
jgi:DNA-binding beta-propeller fold protein YncE